MQVIVGWLSFLHVLLSSGVVIGAKGQQQQQEQQQRQETQQQQQERHDQNNQRQNQQYDIHRMSHQDFGGIPAAVAALTGVSEKRGNMDEPSCDELRAMWRYSKRQSRASEITNEIPTYRDPFSYNVWEPYLDRSQSSMVYRGPTGPARVRGAGGAPIYGRVIHKAPAGHRLRSGMPDRTRQAFQEVTRHYGTVNRHPEQTPRRRPTNFRHVGGSSPSSTDPASHVPQAGSFQHLKELIRTERARELQEQRIAEEVAARAAALKEMTNGRRQGPGEPETRQHYLNSLQPYNDMKNINYDYDQVQYVSNVGNLGQSLSRGDQYGRSGYALR